MQEYALYGDMRKYNDFDNTVTRGSWVKYRDSTTRISYNTRVREQGRPNGAARNIRS
jgi:hypothetical protein